MSTDKYGFVYIWFDRKHRRYYVGCHWGTEDDGYICSSSWMNTSYKNRPKDFRRRILKTNITPRPQMYIEEQRYLDMIKPEEIKPKNPNPKYYNLCLSSKSLWHKDVEKVKTIGQKISAAKKGKSTGPCSPEKAKRISEAKKAAFAKKQVELGYKVAPEIVAKLGVSRRGICHTEEHKAKISAGLQKAWDEGRRSN